MPNFSSILCKPGIAEKEAAGQLIFLVKVHLLNGSTELYLKFKEIYGGNTTMGIMEAVREQILDKVNQ